MVSCVLITKSGPARFRIWARVQCLRMRRFVSATVHRRNVLELADVALLKLLTVW